MGNIYWHGKYQPFLQVFLIKSGFYLQSGVAGQNSGIDLALQFIEKSFKGNYFTAFASVKWGYNNLVEFRARILINSLL
jgi:hypothetical protein